MQVVVCIVGFRNPDDIRACLEALGRATFQTFEVVICENGGDEAWRALTAAVPARLPGGQPVRVLDAGGNVGYAGGVNVCIQASRNSEAWWVLNPDTQPAPEALARMVERLARGDCAAVGCTVHFPDGRVESRGGRWRKALARAVSLDGGRHIDEPADVAGIERRLDYLSGASMLVGRKLVERVGLMREDYFLYGEEVEWFLRARAAGLRLGVAPDARVLHHQGTTTGSVSDVAARGRMPVFLDERNKLLITRDRAPGLLPIVAPGALALLLLRFARKGAWRQTGYALAGWWAGLMNRRGRPAWVSA